MIMKVAVIGSRSLKIDNLGKYMSVKTTEIVSGGAVGVDTSAREYAEKNKVKLTEFFPEYSKFGKAAPIKRNVAIIEYAGIVLAFWDGKSRGTNFIINKCKEKAIPIRVIVIANYA